MATRSNPSPPPDITTSTPDPYTAAREALHNSGYVILPASLFPNFDLPTLRSAAASLTTSARTGSWPYIRTLPKQFPPWPHDASAGIWGVQHLLHPSNPSSTLFAKTYFDPELLRYVAALIPCAEQELTMELYNMLVRPERDFQLRWHRDDIPASASAEEETARLSQPAGHAQWNLALYDDASLVLVPGSHRRARTREEREAGPYAELPGQVVVRLKAGEVAFYDNNLLHRGVYDCGRERLTLHGSMGTVGAGGHRARNVLQHGVAEWAGEDGFGGLEGEMRERACGMRERLVELGGRSGDVGFFSKDE